MAPGWLGVPNHSAGHNPGALSLWSEELHALHFVCSMLVSMVYQGWKNGLRVKYSSPALLVTFPCHVVSIPHPPGLELCEVLDC